MSFSATDAAFEGFRLVRRNPVALVGWTLLYLVYTLATLFAAGGMMRSMAVWMEQVEALEAGPAPSSPEALVPIMESYMAAMSHMVWAIPLSLVIGAVLMAAIARAVLTPATGGFGYMRLGMDEVRVFVVTLVIAILYACATAVAFAAAFIIGGIAIGAMEGWGALVMVLAVLAAIAFMIWLGVRWSLAVPITVDQKKFAFFDSFAVTKGRFWPLLGMAVIAFIMVIIVSLLAGIVTMPISMMGGMSMFGNMGEDPTEMFRNFNPTNPWIIASSVVNAFVYALTVAVLYAPFSAAYRDIVGTTRGAAASE
ncbi:MAG: hypothetical protein Q7U72_11730 [Brevundimonas sp.]|uniref:hypothetical protein n=1 Tax=Brevundimonas sp. TaxID=1871086 RepID=UPI0027234716|nr:hypothetical protein [Brevundimonas sp.]MDO9078102.1 hypothetical protein [Brevundimonas sp.]MDZ4060129.1 hypothetical protein [Brevundimonas sp.]